MPAAIAAGELDAGRLAAMRKLEREGLSAAERRARSRTSHAALPQGDPVAHAEEAMMAAAGHPATSRGALT